MRESYGSMSLHLGTGTYITCCTYQESGRRPILSISAPSVDLMISPAGTRGVSDLDVANARELLEAVRVYMAEIERLHYENGEDSNAASDRSGSSGPAAA